MDVNLAIEQLGLNKGNNSWTVNQPNAPNHITFWEGSDPQPTQEQLQPAYEAAVKSYAWADLRSKRNSLLKETDYLALSDQSMSSAMTTYRQDLRNLPANTSDPENPTWPVKP
tara:strand:+ start:9758 stop:10096 length:339 start_codon:yes stop_codon:yes gene_type:complete